ncbi:MAG: threonine--tRNA ligase, partial [Calditrichaeota bacterium]|nr:threonine--tRNA ligase [Calditrichota bacterium]
MKELELRIPGQQVRRAAPGTKPADLLANGQVQAPADVLAALFNGQIWDLERPLEESGELRWLTFADEEGRHAYWHSSSHLMAHAVKELWPDAQLAIGPPIDDGFYYDIDCEHVFSQEDFPRIEEKMAEIVKRDLPIIRRKLSREEGMALFRDLRESYKLELIEDIADELTVYAQGDFVDLCRGPHLARTSLIKYFKILSVAGAYWRGDERNKMLQRLYATAYPTKQLLDEHLRRLEEAQKRDHRKIGKELELFSIHPEAPGAVFWHPKGLAILEEIKKYWREEHRKAGYKEVLSPIVLTDELWHRSGHWDHYRGNMYFSEVEKQVYALKPMNCPGHLLIYRSQQVSYRDLPLKYCEMGLVHRYEKSGVLHGLFRVRAFTQDDAHIFVTPEQIPEEAAKVCQLIFKMYHDFGFDDYEVELSTRPRDRIGSDEVWDVSEKALESALESLKVKYKVNAGEGAFYGPKIDFHIRDALRRTWQCGTVQCDFSMPDRFGLEYIGRDGAAHTPVMIHRALLGSLERFVGILLEHYAGDLPLWLAPVQVVVLSISEKQEDYAIQVREAFATAGLRAEVDVRPEKINYKIRQAEVQKIPYMAVVGAREAEAGQLALRRHK